jgi:CheY-like chemotaxis protein
MFNFFNIKKLLSSEPTNFNELMIERTTESISLPMERIVNRYDKDKPVVLIIDDSPLVLSMVTDYLNKIGITEADYNIFKFYGLYAPFVMKETLIKLTEIGLERIDYAIIDIVLPGKMKSATGYDKMDGVDVAILLDYKYKCKKFIFFSGNVLNMYIDFIHDKCEKFAAYFVRDLRDNIVIKTSTDDEILERFGELFNRK